MASRSKHPSQERADPFDEIAALAASIARDARRLDETLTGYSRAYHPCAPVSPGAAHPRDLARAGKRDAKGIAIYLRSRRRREEHFPAGIFSDPAWDILLDLFVASAESRQVSVSNACVDANLPLTTGIRWITSLESRDLVARMKDPHDGRRVWVEITPEGIRGVNKWLDDLWPLAAPDEI